MAKTPFATLLLAPTGVSMGKHPVHQGGVVDILKVSYLILDLNIPGKLERYFEIQQISGWAESSLEKPNLSITPSPLTPRTLSVFVLKAEKATEQLAPWFMAKFPYFCIWVNASLLEYENLLSLSKKPGFTFRNPKAIRVTLEPAEIPEGNTPFFTPVRDACEIRRVKRNQVFKNKS